MAMTVRKEQVCNRHPEWMNRMPNPTVPAIQAIARQGDNAHAPGWSLHRTLQLRLSGLDFIRIC